MKVPDSARRLLCVGLLAATVSSVSAAGRPNDQNDPAAPRPQAQLGYDLSNLLADDVSLADMKVPKGAAPLRLAAATQGSRALECLTEAVYHEARSEDARGQRAVAQVVLNRARHHAYPGDICAVVYQGPLRPGGGCQFTFTCDGSRRRGREMAAWKQAERVAQAALNGAVEESVGWATHYHTHEVSPAWGPLLDRVAIIGDHIFYRMPGESGKPAAFSRRISIEEQPAPHRQRREPEARLEETASASAAADPAPLAGDETVNPATLPVR